MTTTEIMARSSAHELGVYARQPVAFVRGRGCELWDADGKRYLDFFAGLSVNNLGHCPPAVVAANMVRREMGFMALPRGLRFSMEPRAAASVLARLFVRPHI